MTFVSSLRLQLFEGESVAGLLLRAARIISPNFDVSMAFLVGQHDGLASSVFRDQLITTIAVSLGVPENDLRLGHAQRASFGSRIVGDFELRDRHLDMTTLRVSPHRLALDVSTGREPFHRLVWTIKALRRDPVSGGAIVDRCATCGVTWLWSKARDLRTCHSCGQAISSSGDPAVCGDPSDADSFFESLFNPDIEIRRSLRRRLPTAASEFAEADLLDLMELLSAMAAVVAGKNPNAAEDTEKNVAARVLVGGDSETNAFFENIFRSCAGTDGLAGVARLGALAACIRNTPSNQARIFAERRFRRNAS